MSESDSSLGRFSGGPFRGPCGEMTYTEGSRQLQIYWEHSPVCDICLYPDFRRWSADPNDAIPEERQLQMLNTLRAWIAAQNLTSSIDAPANQAEDSVLCHWRDCTRFRLRENYYCAHHYDLSCLARDPPSRVGSSNNRSRVP